MSIGVSSGGANNRESYGLYGLPSLKPGARITEIKDAIEQPIEQGTTVYEVAQHYLPYTDYYTVNELITALKKENGLTSDFIYPGDELKIPIVRTQRIRNRTVPVPRDFEVRGIYVTSWSSGSQRLLALAEKFKQLGGNTIIFDGKDFNGIVTFESDNELAHTIKAVGPHPIRDLAKMIDRLHRMGFHIVARQTVFCDKVLALARPDLAIQRVGGGRWQDGDGRYWLDPSQPEVRQYNLDLSLELLDAGVDEIQYDFIRFPDNRRNASANAVYTFDEKKTPRYTYITQFLRQAHALLHGRKALLSIDVFGIMAWSRDVDLAITGQNLTEMARYVDVISPMLYPSHFYGQFQGMAYPPHAPYTLVAQGVKRLKDKLGPQGYHVTIRPWLQGFPFRATTQWGPGYIRTQMEASVDNSGVGWMVWDAYNGYDVLWQTLRQPDLYPNLAQRAKQAAIPTTLGPGY
ncbi:putative glycoside hydrolase [Anthocerotibacter panamensis]|uniref:putative glycoside hydrolase n=1 Tax=Anthocerotibacter panamensis TaxID=2857077 RepID=UPI001C406616|nr:putative glycoside hydrolase [Anthocerotibacter panamensis]